MGRPINNIGDVFNTIGDKVGQFGHWLGDVTGANGAKPVTPYQVDYGQSNEDRANQMSLYQQLQQMAAGNGPSLAQAQLQQATDQNVQNAMGLGAAQQGQGLGYASALRGIADQSAAARQQAAAQSAMIRNAEQMQAMQGMGALSGQMRGQDLGQAGMGQQNAQFYSGLNANIDAQNAAGRRQITGGILNAAGSALTGGLSGLFGGGGGGGANTAPDVSEPTPLAYGGPVPSRAAQLDHITAGRVPGYADGGQAGCDCAPGGSQSAQARALPQQPQALDDYYSRMNDLYNHLIKAGASPDLADRTVRHQMGPPPQDPAMDKRYSDMNALYNQLKGTGASPELADRMTVGTFTPPPPGGRLPGYAMGGALDSPKNDTVHAMLSPGEIVLPRSVTMAPDAAERARLFVQQVKERSKSGPPKTEHYLTAQARRKAG